MSTASPGSSWFRCRARPADLADATWETIKPLYDAVALAPLSNETVEAWLATWSRLEELVSEAASLAMIAYTCDTTDPAKEAAYLRFSSEILPQAEEQGVRLARLLVASGLYGARARSAAAAIPHLDRALPRSQRADHRGARGAGGRSTRRSPAA